MLLGVWLFGSTAMMIGASFSGGGFATGFTDTFVLIVLGLVPPYTLIMSVYDGSLMALLIMTFLAIAVHSLLESDRWILPPALQARLSQWYRAPDRVIKARSAKAKLRRYAVDADLQSARPKSV
jgi:hypothetical protein